jgi:hypothetical protein
LLGAVTVNGSLTATGLTTTAGVDSTDVIRARAGIDFSTQTQLAKITASTSNPSGVTVGGSLHIKSGGDSDSLWVYEGTWKKIRGNMWFTGTANPGALGQQIGDWYYNRLTGEIWEDA